jgi:RHS repeat-associated protein
VPASLFSCSARRRERRLRNESSVCPRPRRYRFPRTFRKTCCSKNRAYQPRNRRVVGNSRTTHLGPFGELIRCSGSMAKANPIRFSTKYQDDETDMDYYGYRFYNPSTGRWLSRDPIVDQGFDPAASNQRRSRATAVEVLNSLARQKTIRRKPGDLSVDRLLADADADTHFAENEKFNLEAFVRNDSVDGIDALGLIEYYPITCELEKKLGKGQCRYKCTCPKGYSMGFVSSVTDQPCDWPAPERTCFRLECWDYVKIGCAVVVVTVVVVGSGGTATTVVVAACAAP